jgi:hypothetical protein
VLLPHGHWPEGRFRDIGPKEIRKQIVALSAPYRLWLAGENGATPVPISSAYQAAGRAENLAVCQEKGQAAEASAIEWLLQPWNDRY